MRRPYPSGWRRCPAERFVLRVMRPPGREFGIIPAMQKYRLLVINPGSTSTKVSIFENEDSVFEKSLFHDSSVLLSFPHVNDQVPFRKGVILDMLSAEGVAPSSIDAFVGRGGSACTQPGGITAIDRKLYDDTVAAVGGSEHPAKLGVMLAWDFAQEYGKPAFTLNPTNVDEYCDYARLTGIKGVYRVSHSHVLNQKAVAEFHASKLGRKYEDCNFIVAHIDGGITVSAHERGKMVDGNMGADGEGAFTPTRIGSVPVLQLLDYIEAHSVEEVRLRCSRAGMIGEMSAVLCGKVDAILLTGGLVRFHDIVDGIRTRCGFIAPIEVYPGEMEQEALAIPALKVLRGELKAQAYSGRNVWPGFGDIGL